MTSVAEVTVRTLKQNGVERIYGLIGTSILDLVDAIKDSGIKYVSARHDQGAVSMATGDARVTRRPGVAAIHGGPGFLNALTGIAVAYKDSVPIVVLAGAVKRRAAGMDSWLEVPQIEIVSPIVKKAFRVTKGQDAVRTIREAYSIAASVPFGPAFVEVPEDVWHLDAGNVDDSSLKITMEKQAPNVDAQRFSEVSKLFRNSKRPLILAGGGINDVEGSRLLKQLAESLRIPVATTGNGRGALSEENDLCLGRCGFGGGNTVADYALASCDALLALGCGLSDVSSYSYNFVPKAEIVSVTLDENAERKPVAYSMLIKSDAHDFAQGLLKEMAIEGPLADAGEWHKELESKKGAWKSMLSDAVSRRYSNPPFVNPGRFFLELDSKLHEDTIISAGQGMHVLYAHDYVKVRAPASYIASTNLGAMGFAFPAAIGAKNAFPDRDVFAILGDGEFLMSISDLETAVREKIGVKIIIVNDNSYRVLLVRQRMQKMGRIFGTLLTNPDVEKLGEAYGLESMSIQDNSRIPEGVNFLLSNLPGPRLLELKISPEDLPPLNVEASLKF
jgi:acetolactate synthase I/II/III large subunit